MKTILFCGDKTRYGFGLLRQLLWSDFNTIGAVLPSHRKWLSLLEKYSGEKIGSFDLSKRLIKGAIKKFVSQSPISKIPSLYLKTINAEAILKKHRIAYWYADEVNSEEHIIRLKKTEPDLFLCAGYPQIFSRELLSLPKYGAINIHPSLLPKYRGPSPFYWIIANGETESGITAHFMTEKIDAGDIIAQIKFPIPDMTSDDLISKSIEETPALIEQIHRFLSDGALAPRKQDESQASYFRFERESDYRLLWNEQEIQQMHNLVRTGRAFCCFKNQKVGITKHSFPEAGISLADDGYATEGTIVSTSNDSMIIKARNGYISFHEVVFKGKTMTPKQLMKRLKMQIGEKFN